MFRELLRKNKQLSMEECVRALKTEKRGVLSVNEPIGVMLVGLFFLFCG